MNEIGFKRRRGLGYTLVLFGLFFAMSGLLWGQSGGGSVVGSVHDPSGAVVDKAAVTLIGIETQTKYKTVTNGDGLFTFPQVQVGNYKLAVSVSGFKESVQEGVTVSVGSTVTVPMTLQVGQASESVVISADALQLESETSDIGTTVPSELLQALPLSFGGLIRSPLQFIGLTPGFEGSSAGDPKAQASFKLSGGPMGSADVLVDGASIELASPNLQWNFGLSTDAVSEYKVQTSTFPAEYGRVGGGFVNLASKSGTNQLHGAVYELIKNNVFDSNGWWNNHQGNKKAFDNQHDFGGFAGGPVRIPWLYNGIDKTFWFFSYEGFRYKSGGEGTADVAPSAMWNGDFSSVLNTQIINGTTYLGRQIYDYTSCSGVNLGKACKPFKDNQISAGRMDPLSKAFTKYLPVAQNQNRAYQNEKIVTVNPVNNDLYSFKIDQNLGAKQKIYGSYFVAHMPELGQTPTYGPLYTNDWGGTDTYYARLAHDYTITPALFNHLNFGYTRRFRHEASPGTVGPWASKLDWHGSLIDKTIPGFSIGYGKGGISTPPSNDSTFADNTYQFNEALSWVHGKHTFKFGAEHRRQEFNVRFLNGVDGSFNYSDTLTSAGNGANGKPLDSNSGFGAASFFLGAISSGSISSDQVDGFRAYYYGMYAQDDWKVSPKLTLNLGLRYEIPVPVFEVLSRTSQVNPTLANPGAGNLPGAMEYQGTGTGRDGKQSPQTTDWKSFGPRLGVAYQLDSKTVARVAYGIYYEALKVSNFANTDSAGFFALNYNFPTPVNDQTPAAIPSQIKSYPGPTPPFLDPSAENGQSPVFVVSKKGIPGAIQNWTVDIQRQLPGQWQLDAAYVGAHGYHLQSLMRDPNVGPLNAMQRGACLAVLITEQTTNAACTGQKPVAIPYPNFVKDFGSGATVSQALRPFPQYGSANLDTAMDGSPYGDYTYEALQVQLNKRISAGLAVMANYTWSKNLTDADGDYPPQAGWNGANQGMLNPYNPRAEKSYSNFDQPQILKVGYTYQLPVGKGQKYLNQNPVLDAVVGGWTVAGFDNYSTGTPLYAYESGWTSGIFAGQATDNSYVRPNVVHGISHKLSIGSGSAFGQKRLNLAAFTVAPSYTFGNAPRMMGDVRNFANRDEDLTLSKRFPLGTEKVNFYFRFDAFNIFNRHTWDNIDENISDTGVDSSGAPISTYGMIKGATGNRTMQGNFRITF